MVYIGFQVDSRIPNQPICKSSKPCSLFYFSFGYVFVCFGITPRITLGRCSRLKCILLLRWQQWLLIYTFAHWPQWNLWDDPEVPWWIQSIREVNCNRSIKWVATAILLWYKHHQRSERMISTWNLIYAFHVINSCSYYDGHGSFKLNKRDGIRQVRPRLLRNFSQENKTTHHNADVIPGLHHFTLFLSQSLR